MAREFSRGERLGSQLQRELAMLVRDEVRATGLGMITIQEVRVVRDLSHAKVYFTMLGGTADATTVRKALQETAPLLRHELGRRLKIRTVPELHFVHDESVERGAHLSQLIEEAVRADESKHR